MPDLADRARALLELHAAPEILVLANVWDVASAQVVAATEGGLASRPPAISPPPSGTRTARHPPRGCTWTWSA